ncbi:hypothetical protein ILYODFUR_028063, partial [Ilyodon furcidens]
MLWARLSPSGTGALHKIKGISKMEDYFQIPFISRSRCLKFVHNWLFHQDTDPKDTSKVLAQANIIQLKWPQLVIWNHSDLSTYNIMSSLRNIVKMFYKQHLKSQSFSFPKFVFLSTYFLRHTERKTQAGETTRKHHSVF